MDVFPQTRWVEGSNFADVNFKIDPRTKRVVMMGAIDNMVKGAAGQAIQNMNLTVRAAGEYRIKAGTGIPIEKKETGRSSINGRNNGYPCP